MSALRQLFAAYRVQDVQDPIVVSCMKDYGIEECHYSTIHGAAQLFINKQYDAAAQQLRKGGLKATPALHQMLGQIALKFHASGNDCNYGSKW